jgi:hypothetical protein
MLQNIEDAELLLRESTVCGKTILRAIAKFKKVGPESSTVYVLAEEVSRFYLFFCPSMPSIS